MFKFFLMCFYLFINDFDQLHYGQRMGSLWSENGVSMVQILYLKFVDIALGPD